MMLPASNYKVFVSKGLVVALVSTERCLSRVASCAAYNGTRS